MGEQTNPPPSIKLTRRATANALWTPLRHALQYGWPTPTDWTHHDPRGNPRSSDRTTGGIPGVLPTFTPTNESGRVFGRLAPDSWPGGGLILAARLDQRDYDLLAAQLTMQEQYEWTQAWVHSPARQPFLTDLNRHGTPTLRRNHDPQSLITPLVADFLAALAGVTHVQLLTPDEERSIELAMLSGDTPDPMRAAEVFAIAQRSGIKERD
ncbi:MAG: hypothetical protein WC972_02990 [Trueperaceae bacterium]